MQESDSVTDVDKPAKPIFAFAFRDGRGDPLPDLATVDEATLDEGFVWAHIDLGDPVSHAWLLRQPVAAEVLSVVGEPIQRGRLFPTETMLYGHLRDLRDHQDSHPSRNRADDHGKNMMHADSLSVLATERMLVTGRRIPLQAVEKLRKRVEEGQFRPETAFGLLTGFFAALKASSRSTSTPAPSALRPSRRRCSIATAPITAKPCSG